MPLTDVDLIGCGFVGQYVSLVDNGIEIFMMSSFMHEGEKLGIKLVIGGKAQGKLAFAETLLPGAEIIDGSCFPARKSLTAVRGGSMQGRMRLRSL